jgi:anti-anti-sigma factor
LRVRPGPGGGRSLELHGELDLTAAEALREALLAQLRTPDPVTLELRAVSYLSSAGVGLLIDAVHHAAAWQTPLRLRVPPNSIPARVLSLTGLDQALPLVTDPTES